MLTIKIATGSHNFEAEIQAAWTDLAERRHSAGSGRQQGLRWLRTHFPDTDWEQLINEDSDFDFSDDLNLPGESEYISEQLQTPRYQLEEQTRILSGRLGTLELQANKKFLSRISEAVDENDSDEDGDDLHLECDEGLSPLTSLR